MYTSWAMQETSMVPLELSFESGLTDWSICGSPSDCVETILEAREKGINAIGFTIYSLPPSPDARIEYLQMIAEEIVSKVARPAAPG